MLEGNGVRNQCYHNLVSIKMLLDALELAARAAYILLKALADDATINQVGKTLSFLIQRASNG